MHFREVQRIANHFKDGLEFFHLLREVENHLKVEAIRKLDHCQHALAGVEALHFLVAHKGAHILGLDYPLLGLNFWQREVMPLLGVDPLPVDSPIPDGDIVDVEGYALTAVRTGGHRPLNMLQFNNDHNVLFI